ncbi:MAG TPA: hypothetical protein VJB63_03910 [Patescibacteria group bacterium]|nr:hypothetical protein [Patescibacteria group bacterium]
MEKHRYTAIPTENPSRRILPARLILTVFPTEVIGDFSSFQKIEQYMQKGYGVVVNYSHFSSSDHLRTIGTFITEVKSIAEGKIVSPIAEHQYNTPIKKFCHETHVTLMPIITNNTLTAYDQQGIPRPDKNSCREKYYAYITTAQQVLDQGGSVFIAPQGGRKPTLGNALTHGPISNLLKNYPNEKLLFVCAG